MTGYRFLADYAGECAQVAGEGVTIGVADVEESGVRLIGAAAGGCEGGPIEEGINDVSDSELGARRGALKTGLNIGDDLSKILTP